MWNIALALPPGRLRDLKLQLLAVKGLMKEGLWSIASGAERALAEVEAQSDARQEARDRALAIAVLSVDPTLLYLLGDPSDLVDDVALKLSTGNCA